MHRLRTRALLATTAVLVTVPAGPVAAKELLAEHIEDYSSSASSNLPGCDDTTDDLYDEFGDEGGWSRTRWSDGNAWSQDWKSSSQPGGDDNDWSDDADFAYFCGHGNVGLVEFTTSNPDRIFRNTHPRWDVDAEWVTFDTSMTLQSSGTNTDTWYSNGFHDLHLLIGWHDSPWDGDTGGQFADELMDTGFWDGGGNTMVDSWFAGSGGCTDQTSGKTQNILAEVRDHYDDHVHGEGTVHADQPHNGIYWIWLHDC